MDSTSSPTTLTAPSDTTCTLAQTYTQLTPPYPEVNLEFGYRLAVGELDNMSPSEIVVGSQEYNDSHGRFLDGGAWVYSGVGEQIVAWAAEESDDFLGTAVAVGSLLTSGVAVVLRSRRAVYVLPTAGGMPASLAGPDIVTFTEEGISYIGEGVLAADVHSGPGTSEDLVVQFGNSDWHSALAILVGPLSGDVPLNAAS